MGGGSGGGTVIQLHPPLHLAGVSTWMETGCQQNDSLADGKCGDQAAGAQLLYSESISWLRWFSLLNPPNQHSYHAPL